MTEDVAGFSRRSLFKSSAVAGAAVAAGSIVAANPASAAAVAKPAATTGKIPTPQEYFGFQIGSDGHLATWDKMVPYFQLIADKSNRVTYEQVGDSTLGYPYISLTISSKKNLDNLEHLIEINNKLADPRGLSPTDAQALAKEGIPFYYVQAGIHSTEVGNSQATIEWAYRLATEDSDYMNNVLDNLVIVMVPVQNVDGIVLVNDYFNATAGTNYSRTYPDLYSKYNGHDDNRDWFMLTQIESRLMVSIQRRFHPQVFQDSHQAGSTAPRMFTPPYLSPYDVNIDSITVQQTDVVGLTMQRAMTAAGMKGGGWGAEYDYWTPSRQYQVYHGGVRILTEAASVSNLAYPLVSDKPIGQQEIDINFIEPYDQKVWTLRQIVDYVSVCFYAGIECVANDTYNWLHNSYLIGTKAVTRSSPYAYVIPAGQRDPQAIFDTLTIFNLGEVEINQATATFTAGGKQYPAGSYVIYMDQPYAGFAKTLLEVQDYPQLLQYPGGPPQQPYDVTAQTLPMLLGFQADLIDTSFSAGTKAVTTIKREPVPAIPAPPAGGAYAVGPESYGVFQIVSRLQSQGIPTYRAAASFTDGGTTYPAGTFLVSPTAAARTLLMNQSKATGIPVSAVSKMPKVAGIALKPRTRIGLMKPANNIQSGWLMWMFDQYKVNYQIVKAQDYKNLAGKFDAIVMPNGVDKDSIVEGLDPNKYPPEWSWAFGVGTDGWNALADFVQGGGTLVSYGSATATAQELLGLPLESVLPTDDSTFYCPGSLLSQEFDPDNPVAWGIEADQPVWNESDDAYKVTDASKFPMQVVSKYPDGEDQLKSGWLIGAKYLSGAVNTVAWTVGTGYAVTFGNQSAFRTWNRAEEKLIFNSMYYGPAQKLTAAQFAKALS